MMASNEAPSLAVALRDFMKMESAGGVLLLVMSMVASRGEGIGTLKDVLTHRIAAPGEQRGLRLSAEIERAAAQRVATLRGRNVHRPDSRRGRTDRWSGCL